MITLGLNTSPHDSAAALVINGIAVAAAEEERFTRVRHARFAQERASWQMPSSAIAWCLAHAGIRLDQVDHISAPALLAHGAAMRPAELADGHDGQPRWRWHVLERHLCHQASAFLAAPFERCAVMTLDGRGDQATIGCGVWRHGRYQRLPDLQVPHPFGLLYERVASHLGLQRSSDEHNLMALAEMGSPVWSYALAADDAWPPDLEAFAGKCRMPGEPLEPRHANLAASMKRVLEAQVLSLAECLREASGERHLALAGGESLQCIASSRLHEQGLFDSVWMQPAAGDAGTALGAALWTDARLRTADGSTDTALVEEAECELAPRRWVMSHAHLGPAWADDEVAPLLRWAGVSFEVLPDEAALAERGAQLLNEGLVLGWFQGRMEWGPHALGSRSLLASPLHGDAQAKLERVAGHALPPSPTAVAAETFADWFTRGNSDAHASPLTQSRHHARPEVARQIAFACDSNGIARVQTIDSETNPRLSALLCAFSRVSGVPMLANAPFSIGSQPIVCSPQDALDAFFESSLDALVIGKCVVLRSA